MSFEGGKGSLLDFDERFDQLSRDFGIKRGAIGRAQKDKEWRDGAHRRVFEWEGRHSVH